MVKPWYSAKPVNLYTGSQNKYFYLHKIIERTFQILTTHNYIHNGLKKINNIKTLDLERVENGHWKRSAVHYQLSFPTSLICHHVLKTDVQITVGVIAQCPHVVQCFLVRFIGEP